MRGGQGCEQAHRMSAMSSLWGVSRKTYLKTTISHFIVRARHAAKIAIEKVCVYTEDVTFGEYKTMTMVLCFEMLSTHLAKSARS